MACTRSNPDAIAHVRFYLDGVAKSLVDRLFGPDGPPHGITLTSLEKTIDAVRSALSEHMLALALSRQAQAYAAAPELLSCPRCRRPTKQLDPEERIVTTDVGRAAWAEPQRHCNNCRRDFFPSVARSGP
jgi:hypothetical protein